MLHLSILGPVRLATEDGRRISLSVRKQEALLAFLATEHSHAHSRESLMGLLWPDSPADKARLSLRVNLSTLKKRLNEFDVDALLHTTSLSLQFRADACLLDVVEFNLCLHSGDSHAHGRDELCELCMPSVARGVDLYRGAFLDGLYLDDCEAYEEWLFMQRERFRVLHLDALEKLAIYHLRHNDMDTALGYARRQLEVDPLREPAHQMIMQIHLERADRTAALRQYERCRAVLEDELGLEPSDEIQELYQQIQAKLSAQAVTARVIVPVAAAPVQTRLPVYLTPFIGRQDELDLLAARIHPGSYRLISLVGAGGMGKTRLAVEAARRQVDHFVDGVYFAPLASVEHAHDVADALAAALGVTFRAAERTAQDQLLDWLRPRRLLLVVDNFEHLRAATPLLTTILEAAPQVTLLVTTRESLALQAEDLIRLTGLPVPASDDLTTVSQAASARLFVDRAYRVDKSFRLDADNAAAVASLCRLVEGRPLGIELAAAQTAHRPCQTIADAIRADLDVLTVALTDVPARHRSLRAVFEQSWQALTCAEQDCFSRLSAFRNPFSVEAAAGVADASLPVLTRLRNAHLIERYDDDERFSVHELLRHFAEDKLARSPSDRASLQQRHADYFLTWLSEQTQIVTGIQVMRAAQTIQAVSDDVRAAWQWACAAQDVTLLARALPVLAEFYNVRGMNTAAEQAFHAALEHIPAGAQALRAHLLVRLGAVLERQGKTEQATAAVERGLALAEEIGDHHALALGRLALAFLRRSTGSVLDSIRIVRDALDALPDGQFLITRVELLIFLATQETESGNMAASDAAYAEARRIVARTGNKLQEQSVLFYAAVDRIDDDEVAARQSIEQALALCPETGDRTLETHILIALGFLQGRIGNYTQAIDYHRRALEISMADHEPIQQSYILHNLCADYYGLGDYEQAYRAGQDALEIAQRYNLLDGIAYAQIHLGHVLAEMRLYEDAKDAFLCAKEILVQMERDLCVVEVDAGLAHVERLLGNLPAALASVDIVYADLVPTPVPGMDEPSRVYLHCYQVLVAAKDSRAQDLLDAAYHYLQSRVAVLDLEDRERFLDAVPANRAILVACKRSA